MRGAARPISLAGLALCTLLVSDLAGAIEFRAGQTVTVSASEVVDDDLFVAGELVRIEGLVRGDLVALGREIVLLGAATGDLVAVGHGIVVDGSVADDARIAGLAAQLGGRAAVGDDVTATVFSLETRPGSLIAGTLLFSGFQSLLAGDVGERILGRAEGLRIEGGVEEGGEVRIGGERISTWPAQLIPSPVPMPRVPRGLSLGEWAVLGSPIVYTSSSPAEVEDAGKLVHVAVADGGSDRQRIVSRVLPASRSWLGIAAVGALLLLTFPSWNAARVAVLMKSPLASLAWGTGSLACLPIASFIALTAWVLALIVLDLVSAGGLVSLLLLSGSSALLALGTLIWVALAFVGPVLSAEWLGTRVLRRSARAPKSLGAALCVGCLLLALLVALPVVGHLVTALATLFGFGCLVLEARDRLRATEEF